MPDRIHKMIRQTGINVARQNRNNEGGRLFNNHNHGHQTPPRNNEGDRLFNNHNHGHQTPPRNNEGDRLFNNHNHVHQTPPRNNEGDRLFNNHNHVHQTPPRNNEGDRLFNNHNHGHQTPPRNNEGDRLFNNHNHGYQTPPRNPNQERNNEGVELFNNHNHGYQTPPRNPNQERNNFNNRGYRTPTINADRRHVPENPPIPINHQPRNNHQLTNNVNIPRLANDYLLRNYMLNQHVSNNLLDLLASPLDALIAKILQDSIFVNNLNLETLELLIANKIQCLITQCTIEELINSTPPASIVLVSSIVNQQQYYNLYVANALIKYINSIPQDQLPTNPLIPNRIIQIADIANPNNVSAERIV